MIARGGQREGAVALVTGASGFVGGGLVDVLLAQGTSVRVVTRPESRGPIPRGAEQISPIDIRSAAALVESRLWTGTSHVIHLAGLTKARTRAEFDAGNLIPTRNICAAIAALPHPRPRLIYVSSQAAVGPSERDLPTREDDEPHPVEAYGESKLAAERVVQSYMGDFEAVIVRPAAVYGPRDRDFLKAFQQACGRVAVHASPRTHQISIVHVDDLVNALLLAATHPAAAGRIYHVANDEPVSWGQFYAAVSQAAGTHPYELEVPSWALKGAGALADVAGALTGRTTLLNHHKVALALQPRWLLDASRVRDELGWRPQVALADGVRDTLQWYRDNGWMPAARAGTPAAF